MCMSIILDVVDPLNVVETFLKKHKNRKITSNLYLRSINTKFICYSFIPVDLTIIKACCKSVKFCFSLLIVQDMVKKIFSKICVLKKKNICTGVREEVNKESTIINEPLLFITKMHDCFFS